MTELMTTADFTDTVSVWLANQVLVRGTLVLALAALAAAALRRASAAERHAVWVLAVAALVLMPLAALLPGARERAADAAASPALSATGAAPSASGLPVTGVRPHVARRAGVRAPGPLPQLPDAWIWIWAAGAVLGLGVLSARRRRAQRLVAAAEPAGPRARRLTAALAREVGLRRDVRVLRHDGIRVPLTVGAMRPFVLVPPCAEEWSARRLRSALLHELAHVARWDYPAYVGGQIVRALYWPVPLAWWAVRRLEREREQACDDRVLAWGTGAAEYAQHLVDIARTARPWAWGAAASMAGRGVIGERIRAILSPRRRSRWGAATWAAGLLTTALVVLTLSGFDLVQTTHDARRGQALRDLADGAPAVRRHAAWMLGELESADDVEALAFALADPDARVRRAAAWALGEIKDPASIEALAGSLQDDDERVREIAALSLGEIQDRTAIPYLLAGLEADESLRGPVAWALREIGGAALTEEHGLGPAPDPELWSGALRPDLARPAGASDVDVVADVLRGLSAGDASVRRAAAVTLGRVGAERAVDPLLDALSDADPGVRAAAVWALDEINPSR